MDQVKMSAISDERVDFMREQAFTVLRLKTDKWNRFIGLEENQRALLDFLDQGWREYLLLFVGPGGTLHTGDEQSSSPWRTKLLCVLKKKKGVISKTTFRTQLWLGEVAAQPMDHAPVLFSQVFVSVLGSPLNQSAWPRVVGQDICRHLEHLCSEAVTLRGRSQGRTLLPLPLCVERKDEHQLRSDFCLIDRALLYSIETMVIQWCGLMGSVLQRDSSKLLHQGDHPGPTVELSFWTKQKENLLGIQKQLQNPKVDQVLEILLRIKSSYYDSFYGIIQKVNHAVMEAEDIDLHLRTLRRPIAAFEERSFTDLEPLIPALFHTLALIWTHSHFYCHPPRIVTLLTEFCNLLIDKASVYLIPEELFKMELEEGMDRVRKAIQVFWTFKRSFQQHRDKLTPTGPYGRPGLAVKPWDFPSELVFHRTDCIMERLRMIEELFASALDFLKLERIELGGSRGKILSDMVYSMNDEFMDSWRTLRESKYDPLDYNNKEFVRDYNRFMEQNRDFDQRLGTVINLAFQHSPGLESAFKLLQIFGSLLERPRVHQLFAPNYSQLLVMFQVEVNLCQHMVETHREKLRNGCPVLGKNMPAVAGNLKWSQELRERILSNRSNLSQLTHIPLDSPEAQQVLQVCECVLEVLDQMDEEVYTNWSVDLDELCHTHLNEPLLILDEESSFYCLNFNPALTSVLREVKYLGILKNHNIPKAAVSLYSKWEMLHMYTSTLFQITQWYNKLHSTILAVELRLVESELEEVRCTLMPALKELRWSDEQLVDYIKSTRDLVRGVSERVQKSKANLEKLQGLMGVFSHSACITRRTNRRGNLLNLTDVEENFKRQYALVSRTGEKIHELMQENAELLGADLESDAWQSYTEHVDRNILTGFCSAVRCSLQYLVENTDPALHIDPLFEVQLTLTSDMTFYPSLNLSKKGNFYDIIDQMLSDIFKMASFMKRVAKSKQSETYKADVDQIPELVELAQLVRHRARGAIAKVKEFQHSFDSYRYLWTGDRVEFMRQFLLYGHALTAEEAELYADYELPKNPPKLQNFREQISEFEELYEKVRVLEEKRVFYGWCQVDIKPFKISLMNIIKKWSWMFKEHLLNHVNASVQELGSFIENTEIGLAKTVTDGDYSKLVDIMGHLMAIRDRQGSTEQHFKPLKATSNLLKTYNQQLPEHVYILLESLPEKWKNLKKVAFTVKHEVAPLQSNEVAVIRRKCVRFEVKQHEFREQFRTEPIFFISLEDPYKLIDKTNRAVAHLESEMSKLQQTANLFEVSFPDYKQLRQCRSDIILVKAVWDMVMFVKSCISDWTKTPWKEINVEQMDMELRRFAKEMKTLDKDVRAWDVYNGLESIVKNLLTSLRAVNELQNFAVRERHWQQLMHTTGVSFVMDENTTLGDLLELQLHRVEEEVKNIVDKAVKEMGIEKILGEIQQTWSMMSLSYETHTSTGTPLLKANENLIETLEDNQVQLQNILMSKYVEYFIVEVSGWQRKLVVADLVIGTWLAVQRTWAHLQSIFTNSEDIRNQLAHDAERFQGIHQDFQGLMITVVETNNVIKVTNQPGFLEQLETLQQRLSVCEKALAEYLETKRLTFPRFYFVSASDLLEIVSKGTQPRQVTRHLLKLFDNLADLRFKEDDDGATDPKTTVALGMYSREGEYVPFSQPCVCEGQAECWLSTLEKAMRSTVRQEISEAVAAYEDKPRDQWLFDYPAQVALTGSQIWWAIDVGIAFERVEEGFETALKDYNRKQIGQLHSLIHMLLGDLTPGDRQKIMTICTIDVHARDVVAKLVSQKVTSGQAFAWLSQLRHRWDEQQKHCYINICDAQFQFSYEYLGNTNRLVITPLTDRCYITLTQSLHLTMSGATSGPAGTGKTETTKDLGRSLGIMVYVFNCSEQMDYKSIGNIYKGLAQTGVWGCFDEFNRISVEVLSVVAVQVKTIQDAVRNKKQRFHFLGEEIELRQTVGIFITLNPGYAGRTELPENLKALFRPCAMVIPDYELICEIMLVAEGFIEARLLARKFISLYTLCKELLSKQDHYDWGLRAIKSVLVVAGSLKREERSRPEEQVLMRALRDFNLPKVVTSDVPIFLGLISDLFPLLDIPRKRDNELEQNVRQSVAELHLQPEENFILKVTQLEELLAVRHSVFVVGGPGTGKSQILKTLHKTYSNMKLKPIWTDINPKAVTTDELFGFLHPATREWKDGLFSSTMRELSAISHDGPKWIVLDGDIDPMWIESLNTVMDDNKVLTLASNERISLTPSMRLLFEISHLKAATPATVSRAGILYVNPQDLGWSSFVTSWIDTRQAQSERANLTILFDKYVPYCLEQVRCNLKTITPIPEMSMVQTLCCLLDCLLTDENTPPDSPRELYELYFVFACVWAFGGALFQDHLIDYRSEFSRWWCKEMRAVKFPSQGSVFDYYIDPNTKRFTPWSERTPPFELEPDIPLQRGERMRKRSFALPEHVRYPIDLVHLWLHESSRVYSDKLMEEKDVELFNKILLDTGKRYFEGIDESIFINQPLIYCHFAHGMGEPRYAQVTDLEKLQKSLMDALEHYNELHSDMNLVLFEEAMQHICRISRILESPMGNALLIGVGGSGKQSLCRLAAFLSVLEVFQITLRKGYGISDLRSDIAALYIKVGVKNIGTVFLHTDAQIPDERFLVLINDMLASGDIPDLFSEEEVDMIVTSIRVELRALGLLDTRENCWNFFIDRIRRQLKVVLCFSPVGFTLRTRARKFPALVNCTAIDWFHPWPQHALQSVSSTFIQNISGLEPEVRVSISEFISFAHTSVNEVSVKYQQNEKRFNYTTPKSFLEFMKLYGNLLGTKRRELRQKMERLENGLQKLLNTASQVEDLKAKLATQEVELQLRNTDTEALIAKIGQQSEKLSQERSVADAEEQKVEAIQAEVTKQQQETEADLWKAEPALQAANAALNTLNRLNLTELRTFPNPPAIVSNVSAAVLVLLAPGGRIPKDRSWKASKVVMSKVDDFLQALVNFDKEHIPEATVRVIKDEYLSDPEFNPEFVRLKSSAAAGLCAWVINIIRFHETYVLCEVEVKRMCLSQANADLAEAAEKLEVIRKKLTELDGSLDTLKAAFEKATSEKLRCQDEVNHTNNTIKLANRLVKGLESENVRWVHSVAQYREQESTLCGDVLLTAAFISYAGSFSKRYREELLHNLWMPYLRAQKVPIPMTEGLDPISMLTDGATIAKWNNEGLPGDKISTQNATILTNCERWPLLIDPQLQGIKWLKSRYGNSLKVINLSQKGYVDVIEQAVVSGQPVLIENLEETIEPVIDPLLGRHTIKKGRCIKVGDKECYFHPDFRLILHTKLANPHYKPEIQAQTTLINFTVTRDGLEDQLLAEVVNLERPDLEHLKSELTKQQNTFKIELKQLEDELLTRLSAAENNFLGDNVLVEKLESTKHTAAEIEMKVLEAKVNEVKINEAREHYRAVAVRASLLYFIINDLNKINPMYQFSLKAFNVVFHKAVQNADASSDVKTRVNTLIDCITFSTFNYINRGLFERDKLTFAAQLTFQLLLMSKEVDPRELDFLLRFNIDHNYASPVDFLSNTAWSAVKTMSFTDEFRGLDRDIEGSPKRWKKVVESECPEKEKLPQEWKSKSSLQKLILMRALRPDRMTYAVRNFVEEKLGVQYTESRKMEFARSFKECGPASPVFFILSPGVDPLKDVESLGKKLGFTIDLGKLHNVSLGQGQESVAELAMEKASREGHWVILQNIHLVAKWLGSLEKLLECCCENSHQDYRVFMSAEPSPTPQEHIIPQGILENSIKITNEPPTGMLANLHAALDNFDQDILDQCSREQEFKTILFSLCYFHACVAERRKFGPQGWNRKYPFNTGDLTISVNVLYNYLEANSQVPWEDLRYLFGEIMYGGHITDDWDRRLCRTYLEEYMQPNQFDRKLSLAPGLVVPSNLDYQGYHAYIDEMLPHESPVHYGLHPNAEIEFLTVTSDSLFHTLLELQYRDSNMGEGASQTTEEKVKTILDDILEKLPEEYNMSDITSKTAERSPYILVCLQECERMNMLLNEIRRSLKELDLGLKGELAISSEMEQIQTALFFDNVPDTWTRLAYPSIYSLGQWYNDVLLRCRELDSWTHDLSLPSVVWISGLFNPQSFLTAVMQSLARKNEWPLDKMNLTVDVTKKFKEEFNQPAREGAYIYGLYMEGARWDIQGGTIAEARLKELTPSMPVIAVRAIPNDRQEMRNTYECPVYKTKLRANTYIWTFSLKTRERPAKWVLAGVALLLSV
ncbi:dynein heavy chain 11, axonemal [Pimephales promelas]|uniref:dynein heavy chain 11, axonemal n=1 Tax=Pimephales promelas TaxID=90988 RepID=UPI00195556F6|nr:dynein heavy chain 11, axonemal [Pimephales promelas]